MPFYKVTYNSHSGIERVCVYNWGCNFRCKGCAYKLKPREVLPSENGPWLSLEGIKATLLRLGPRRVHFLGGEPTTNPSLPGLARFAHDELGATVKVGHTNGSGKIPEGVDEAAFSIKALNCRVHEDYTGSPNGAVLDNFIDAYGRGIGVSVSTVLIPGVVGAEDVGRLAEFVGGVDRGICFHITAYMPVPGVPYPAPSRGEMGSACALSEKHLDSVSSWSGSSGKFYADSRKPGAYDSVRVA